MNDGPFQPTPISAVRDEVLLSPQVDLEDPLRVRYRDWLKDVYDRRFGLEGKPMGALIINDHVVTFDRYLDDGLVEQLIAHAFYEGVGEGEEEQFLLAVKDIVVEKASLENPNLEEVESLANLVESINAFEAGVAIADALVANQALSSNKQVSHAVFRSNWMLIRYAKGDDKTAMQVSSEKIIDELDLPGRDVFEYVQQLISYSPKSVSEALNKYGEKIKALCEDIRKDSRLIDSWQASFRFLREQLKKKRIKLTPEQLAILQI